MNNLFADKKKQQTNKKIAKQDKVNKIKGDAEKNQV